MLFSFCTVLILVLIFGTNDLYASQLKTAVPQKPLSFGGDTAATSDLEGQSTNETPPIFKKG